MKIELNSMPHQHLKEIRHSISFNHACLVYIEMFPCIFNILAYHFHSLIIIQVKILFQDLLSCLLSLFIFKPKFPIWFSFFLAAFSCVFGNHLSHKCVPGACIIFRDFSFIRSSFESFLC